MEKYPPVRRIEYVFGIIGAALLLNLSVSLIYGNDLLPVLFPRIFTEETEGLYVSYCNGSSLEKCIAGEAADAVEDFYRNIGFHPLFREKLTIEFGDEICPDGKVVDWVIGLYHREKKRIYICSLDSPLIRDNPRFSGLDLSELYRSILAHEISHHFNHSLCPGLFPPVDEAIAGFVQYSIMDPKLRVEMLERVEAASLTSVRDFNIAAYINGPDEFLGGAYLYLRNHPSMVDRILQGRAPAVKDPMFVEF